MARALKCDYCGSFAGAADPEAANWVTIQVFPTQRPEADEDYTEGDFCSEAHAMLHLAKGSRSVLRDSDMFTVEILEMLAGVGPVTYLSKGRVREAFERLRVTLGL